MNLSFLKIEAKNCVKGNRLTLLKPYLITWLVSYGIGIFFSFLAMGDIGFDVLQSMEYESAVELISNSKLSTISSIVSLLLTTPLQYGVILYYNQFEMEHRASVNIIFSPLKHLVKIFVITLFVYVLVSIGFSILIIPGVILSCAFAIIPYVYSKNLEYGVMETVIYAWRLMKGHKMEYLKLELSFIGYYLLSMITCGIAYLWVIPYHQMTIVKYFNELEKNYISY